MRLLVLGLTGLVASVFGYTLPGPGIEVVYQGEACGCGQSLGYTVESPCPAVRKESPRDVVGYQIVVPPVETLPKPTYSFDFHIEVPQPTKEQVQL